MDRSSSERDFQRLIKDLEQVKPEYQTQYEEAFSWLSENIHVGEHRGRGGPEYLRNTLRAAAALVAVLSMVDKFPIPGGIRWETYRGHPARNPEISKSCVSMSLEDLRELTGIKLPFDIPEPGVGARKPFIGIIWNASGEEDLGSDKPTADNLVSTYPISTLHQLVDSAHGDKWHRYGMEQERKLISDFFSRRGNED